MNTMDWSILLFAVFLFSAINATSENTDSGTILGCDPKQSTNNQGFDITYYGYPMVDRNGKGQCFTYDTSYKESWYQQGDIRRMEVVKLEAVMVLTT